MTRPINIRCLTGRGGKSVYHQANLNQLIIIKGVDTPSCDSSLKKALIHKLINHICYLNAHYPIGTKCVWSFRQKITTLKTFRLDAPEHRGSFPPSMFHLISHEWHNTQFKTLEHVEKQHIWLVWEEEKKKEREDTHKRKAIIWGKINLYEKKRLFYYLLTKDWRKENQELYRYIKVY